MRPFHPYRLVDLRHARSETVPEKTLEMPFGDAYRSGYRRAGPGFVDGGSHDLAGAIDRIVPAAERLAAIADEAAAILTGGRTDGRRAKP